MIIKIDIEILGVRNERYFISKPQAIVYLNSFVKRMEMDAKCEISSLDKDTIKKLCKDIDAFVTCKSPKGASIEVVKMSTNDVIVDVCSRLLANKENDTVLAAVANEMNISIGL